jgi:hypothetical protein
MQLTAWGNEHSTVELIIALTLCLKDRHEKQASSSGRMGSLVNAKRFSSVGILYTPISVFV